MEILAMKGLESKGCESSDASIRSRRILKENSQPPAKRAKFASIRSCRILKEDSPPPAMSAEFVSKYVMQVKKIFPVPQSRKLYATGYDTRLHTDVVKKAVIEHFSSCGKVVLVNGLGIDQTGGLNEECLVILSGEGAIEKALKLDVEGCNCDVDGCKIVVDMVLEEDDYMEPLVIGQLKFATKD